jgi:ADP-L-glycero-D-manno-heptose 6-epimerase
MIVITGAAGFIASYTAAYIAEQGFGDLVLVDDFSKDYKKSNYENKKAKFVERSVFPKWLKENAAGVQMLIHLGARTDTTEFDYSIHEELNLEYSKTLWNICVEEGLPFIYASSGATYGLGEFGYADSHELPEKLKPLNAYGISKNEFDVWALKQERQPYFWAGLKFFNVYGPNEYHKSRMASVIFHAFKQIKETKAMKLFASHNADYKDGEQLRDFVYVRDVASVIFFLMNHRKNSGLYNLGTGEARTFNALVTSVFHALELTPDISYIPTPEDIRDKYQYFTEADMSKLIGIGYNKPFTSLEDGVTDYVKNYLNQDFKIV